MLENWKQRYKAFCEWQKKPHHVNPMSEEEHVCATCARHYVGNYCPQCGQSACIGRYSFKNAVLLFLDVWGLGNRGMFRTIRDLFLRPGYMISDYLKGMQMAYFPPFKMLFLLFALSLIVNTGVNIRGENYIRVTQEKFEKDYLNSLEKSRQAKDTTAETVAKKEELTEYDKLSIFVGIDKVTMELNNFENRYETLLTLMLLFVLSGPLYLLFRHCPNIPDMRFSEFFVAIVYITNMLTMIGIVLDFFYIRSGSKFLFPLLMICPLKQLSGYSYVKTFLKTVLVFLLLAILYLATILAAAIIYAFFVMK